MKIGIEATIATVMPVPDAIRDQHDKKGPCP